MNFVQGKTVTTYAYSNEVTIIVHLRIKWFLFSQHQHHSNDVMHEILMMIIISKRFVFVYDSPSQWVDISPH